jgi:hypothetical protein
MKTKSWNIKLKRLNLILAVAVWGVTAISARASIVPVFDYGTTPSGNQGGGPYLLGLSFAVNTPITVTALGAFDSGALGFSSSDAVQVGIYEYSGGSVSGGSASVPGSTLTLVTPIVTFSGSQGTLPNQDESEFSAIAATTLSPGNYVVMASDYTQNTSLGNDDYNTGNTSSSPIVFNPLGGTLSLNPVGIWTRSGATLGAGYTINYQEDGQSGGFGFDPATGGYYGPHPQPTYAAGTFAIAVPEPTSIIAGALLLLPFGASTLRILRKRQVP